MDTDQEVYGIYRDNPIYEGDLVKELRFKKLGLSVDGQFQAYKVYQVEKFLKEWLDQNGYPRATVRALGQTVGEPRMRLRFVVERGEPLTTAEIVFIGNENVPSSELTEDFVRCSKGRGFSKQMLEYCAQRHSRSFMWTKGFLKARVNDVSFSLRKNSRVVTIKVSEGQRYRIGSIEIEGNKVIPDNEILAMLGQYPGDTVDGRKLQDFVYEQLKSKYGELGYVEYDAEFEPIFIDLMERGSGGIVNILITINEGRRFSVRTIRFSGVDDAIQKALLSDFPLKPGDIFVQSKFAAGIDQINRSGTFQFIDKDQHVDVRTGEEVADIELSIRIKER